jgi:hypothetical protein
MSGSTAVQNMQLLELPVTKVDMTPLKTHDCYNEYIYGVGYGTHEPADSYYVFFYIRVYRGHSNCTAVIG